MSSNHTRMVVCGVLLATATIAGAQERRHHNWGQWRGPLATGEAPLADPPIHWSESETDSVNIRWKLPIPGRGHSTPIVWDNHVFVTTAVPHGEALPPRYSGAPGAHDNLPITHRHQFELLAISRKDGQVLWRRRLAEALPHEGAHNTGSLASNSPVTDGERVYVTFGSYGLFCLDFDGQLLWERDFGRMQTKHGHGEGSSPALYGDTLIVNWDHEGPSFIMALDKLSGKERWRVERDEVTSWASPIVVEVSGRPQVIVSGTKRVRGYDLETGESLWECSGLSDNVVASPVSNDGIVVAASSYDTRNMLAIRLGNARDDITDSKHVLWSRQQRTPYVPSLLLYDNWVYFLRHYQGILSRVELHTGSEPVGPFRLGGLFDIYGSPVAAANRVYVTGRNGTTLVLDHREPMKEIAKNPLLEGVNASVAVVGEELIIRGERSLYCIAEDD